MAYGNPIISDKVQEKAQRVHAEFLREAKPLVDCGAPQTGSSLSGFGKDFVYKKKVASENAFNDLKMIQNIAHTMTRPFSLPPRSGPVSLNRGIRKQAVDRINAENAKILARLESLKPQISAKQQQAQYDRAQRYMVNASYSMRRDVEKKLKLQRSLANLHPGSLSVQQSAPSVEEPQLRFVKSRPVDEEEEEGETHI